LIISTYQLRIPSDVTLFLTTTSESESTESDGFTAPPNKPEFEVSPACATVMPFSKQKITVDFTSFRIKKYDLMLIVDVDGVGRDMLELPIKADCRTPKVPFIIYLKFLFVFIFYF
jgi:hydrocephalus-inducing protein